MAQRKIKDKDIYPVFSIEERKLIANKIEHLIETIKKYEKGSSQTSISVDSGVGRNFLSRIKSKNEYIYFDCNNKKIDDFIDNLVEKHHWLNINKELFYFKTTIEVFKEAITVKRSSLTTSLSFGVPRLDFEFRGRESDINSLKVLIESSRSPRINITNPSCVGKTSLLIELVRKVVGNMFDKVVWVTARKYLMAGCDVMPVTQGEILLETILDSIILQIGAVQEIPSINFTDKYKKAIELIKKFKTLLIIDNFELVNDSKVNEFLLIVNDICQVIATSRSFIDGFDNKPIVRMSVCEINTIIDDTCLLSKTEISDEERRDLEIICGGNLVAVKWILGQVAALNYRLELIIKNLLNDSNTYILEHIFGFTFSKLDHHAKAVLFIIANAPIDITGNLIANSINFENLDDVEKSLGVLVKFGLISEFKLYDKSTNARISLSSKYSMSSLTVNYVKSKSKEFDIIFHRMLYSRFQIIINQYEPDRKNDRNNLIEFLSVWSRQALNILNELEFNNVYSDNKYIYRRIKLFLGFVTTKPSKLSIAIFDLNAKIYNTEACITFLKFIERLLLIENKFHGITGECGSITKLFHPYKNDVKLNDIDDEFDNENLKNNFFNDKIYEDFIKVKAALIYSDEDIKEISPYIN